MSAVLHFEVIGIPVPKGSTKSFVVTPKGGKPRAVTTAANPKTKGWQSTIANCAALELRRAHNAGLRLEEGPITLDCWFYLPRPQALLTNAKAAVDHPHVKKPDLDKLARACKDALTGVLWTDDSQVTDLYAHKRYCAAGAFPRVVITVRRASHTDHSPLLAKEIA